MSVEASVPPIVLFVTAQGAPGGGYSRELEQAGYWVATSGCLPDGLQEIVELQPDIVIADLTTRGQEREEEELVRTLKANSDARGVPLLVLEDENEARGLVTQVETLIAVSRRLRQRAAATTEQRAAAPGLQRTCPACGRRLEWVDRGVVGWVEYDYYRWCETGCGLYCFSTATDEWVKIA